MRINIERSGGLAGIKKMIQVETENLPDDISDIMEGYFSKPDEKMKGTLKSPVKKRKLADCYNYTIITPSGKNKKKFTFNELDIDQELRLAFNFIFKNVDTSSGLSLNKSSH